MYIPRKMFRTAERFLFFTMFFVDEIYLKRSLGGKRRNVSILIAVGVNDEEYREILSLNEGCREDKESWCKILR